MEHCNGHFSADEKCKRCQEVVECFKVCVRRQNDYCQLPNEVHFSDPETISHVLFPKHEACRTCKDFDSQKFNLCQAVSRILTLKEGVCSKIGFPSGEHKDCLSCAEPDFMLCQGLELTLTTLGRDSHSFFQKELIVQIQIMKDNDDGDSCFGSFAFSPECQVCDFKIACMKTSKMTGNMNCAFWATDFCPDCPIVDCPCSKKTKFTPEPEKVDLKKKIFDNFFSLVELRKKIMIVKEN